MKNQDFKTITEVENLDVAESRKVLIPSTSGEKLVEADRYQAVWNLSRNSLGCIASKDYHIIQHKEVVVSLFNAIKGLNIKYDFNMKAQGHRVFLDISFPDTKLLVQTKGLVKGEEFIGGIRLINSYDKTTGLLILPRLCRVACANGMIVDSFIKGYSIRHNQKLIESFSSVIEIALADMVNSCDKLQAVVNDCIGDSTEWEYVEIILKNLIHHKKHFLQILENLTWGVSCWRRCRSSTDWGYELKMEGDERVKICLCIRDIDNKIINLKDDLRILRDKKRAFKNMLRRAK